LVVRSRGAKGARSALTPERTSVYLFAGVTESCEILTGEAVEVEVEAGLGVELAFAAGLANSLETLLSEGVAVEGSFVTGTGTAESRGGSRS